jgi:hypothetical protein
MRFGLVLSDAVRSVGEFAIKVVQLIAITVHGPPIDQAAEKIAKVPFWQVSHED